MKLRKSKSVSAILFTLALSTTFVAQATVVEVRTVLGNFQINLFDQTTPATVENFLSEYVEVGAYTNNVVHRIEPGFVMQAGGFTYNNAFPLDTVPAAASVINEPKLSNVRGTVAMAKLSGNPNSATSQWFVNVSNNAANLDAQNGGFTVFGQVLGDGMDVVDAIMATPRFDFGGAFGSLPLRNFSALDASEGTQPSDNNLVIITEIVVVDANVVTNSNLNPVPNTSLVVADSGGGSGGSVGIILVSLFALFGFTRRVK